MALLPGMFDVAEGREIPDQENYAGNLRALRRVPDRKANRGAEVEHPALHGRRKVAPEPLYYRGRLRAALQSSSRLPLRQAGYTSFFFIP